MSDGTPQKIIIFVCSASWRILSWLFHFFCSFSISECILIVKGKSVVFLSFNYFKYNTLHPLFKALQWIFRLNVTPLELVLSAKCTIHDVVCWCLFVKVNLHQVFTKKIFYLFNLHWPWCRSTNRNEVELRVRVTSKL